MEAILFFADSNGRSVAAAALRSIALSPGANAIDEQQFQALHNANARPIHAYLLSVTGNKDVADDVLQETWFRFLQRRPAGLSLEETRPYLFRIATNLLRDRWRGRREAQLPDGFDETRSCDIDTQLEVQRVMRALKPRERELLWLAYVEGMTHQEIAIATGLTALSIRPLLFRARQKAASLLRREGKGA